MRDKCNRASENDEMKSESLMNELEIWRRDHALVVQLIDKINQCFGPILLLAVTSIFILFVTINFTLTMLFQNGNTLFGFFILKLIKQIYNIIFITFGIYKMKTEVYINSVISLITLSLSISNYIFFKYKAMDIAATMREFKFFKDPKLQLKVLN